MKKTLIVLALLIFMVPTAVWAICGDGKVDEKKGENCDPRSGLENSGCDAGYLCAPSVCQCVIDYGAGEPKPKSAKKKVRIKKR